MYSLEEFDQAKIRVLKFIMYKKRTENEIRNKFCEQYDEELLESIIEYLKETNYINDSEYIERTINNFKILKKMSKKELKYKLIAKGLDKNLIENYYYNNKEELNEYEINSAISIIIKKRREMEEIEIKNFLYKRGYETDNINIAFEQI